MDMRYEIDFVLIPRFFHENPKKFIERVLEMREDMFINIFAYVAKQRNIDIEYFQKRFDFRSLALQICENDDKTRGLIIVHLPNDDEADVFCTQYIFTYKEGIFGKKNIKFFTVEKSALGTCCVGTIDADGNHCNFGMTLEDADNIMEIVLNHAF